MQKLSFDHLQYFTAGWVSLLTNRLYFHVIGQFEIHSTWCEPAFSQSSIQEVFHLVAADQHDHEYLPSAVLQLNLSKVPTLEGAREPSRPRETWHTVIIDSAEKWSAIQELP